MNNQHPESQSLDSNNESVDVVDIWKTIQGEGPYGGVRAVFIRLAGCNLRCPLCDTDYTTGRRILSPNEILQQVASFLPLTIVQHTELVVLTGGEPFRQNIAPLVSCLVAAGYVVQIETNGTFAPRPYHEFNMNAVTVVCSPKTPKVNEELLPLIQAWKYVLRAGFVSEIDGLPTETLGMRFAPARPPKDVHPSIVYIQPCDEDDSATNLRNRTAVLESTMKFGYRFSVQLHKLVGVA